LPHPELSQKDVPVKRSLSKFICAAALLLTAVGFVGHASARGPACPLSGSIAVNDLPKQGKDTLALIESGGPFASDRDGIPFSNREKILPKERRGFYREYTVRTPGVKSRGARRIVCGGDQQKADQCFYTEDHYKSFKCIAR
jgi:ribonuclease T1